MSELVLTYYSDVKDGHLQKNVRETLGKELAAFNGKRVEIRIQRLKSSRSVQQNRLYWLYATILAKEIGYDKEEMHEILKYKFLRKEKINEESGEVYYYAGSTAKLTKSEFTELIDSLIRWCAEEFNVILPHPGERTELEFTN